MVEVVKGKGRAGGVVFVAVGSEVVAVVVVAIVESFCFLAGGGEGAMRV